MDQGQRKDGKPGAAKAPASLERRLGYQFKDRSLLERALTHSSARGTGTTIIDNERLEFLGDRVLGLVIAELVLELHPDAAEGDVARRYNRLVRREACADVGRELDLGAALVLGGGEGGKRGEVKDSILADACEAVLGAIFLDAGFDAARQVVRRLWSARTGGDGRADADAKSALQEWAQGLGLPLPTYAAIAREGPDHAPRFTSEVRIRGLDPARGEGASKRLAEQAAAAVMLARERVDGGGTCGTRKRTGSRRGQRTGEVAQ